MAEPKRKVSELKSKSGIWSGRDVPEMGLDGCFPLHATTDFRIANDSKNWVELEVSLDPPPNAVVLCVQSNEFFRPMQWSTVGKLKVRLHNVAPRTIEVKKGEEICRLALLQKARGVS